MPKTGVNTSKYLKKKIVEDIIQYFKGPQKSNFTLYFSAFIIIIFF